MSTPEIHLIAALAANGTIGAHGGLPWHLPDDLKRFRALTLGKAVVFGRTTWQGMNRELPGRHVIVLSANPAYKPAHGAHAAATAEQALQLAEQLAPGQPVMVAGGARVYELFLPLATQLLLTHIHADVVGDTTFPAYTVSAWQPISKEPHQGNPPFTYSIYTRK